MEDKQNSCITKTKCKIISKGQSQLKILKLFQSFNNEKSLHVSKHSGTLIVFSYILHKCVRLLSVFDNVMHTCFGSASL